MPLQINNPSTVVPSMIITSLTQGSVLFAGPGGLISQDNSNFFWDNTNKRLGIGTAAAPAYQLDLLRTPTTVAAAEKLSQFSLSANPGALATGVTYITLDVLAATNAACAFNVGTLEANRMLASHNVNGITVTTLAGSAYQAILGVVFGAAAGTALASNVIGITLQAVNNSLTVGTISALSGANISCDTRGGAAVTNLFGASYVVGASHASAVVSNFYGNRITTVGAFGAVLTAGTLTNSYMMYLDAFPAASGTLIYTNAPEQLHLVAPVASTHIAIRQLGSSVLGQNRFQSFCKFGADSAPAVQMDIVGGITQITGAVSLTANAASSFTTSAGALTLTAAAASTWKTSAGDLTVDAGANLNLGTVASTGLTAGRDLAGYNIGISGDVLFIGQNAAATFIILGSGGAATNPGALQMSTGGYILYSNVPNGATAVGFLVQTANTFSTAGAKLVQIANGATERFFFDKSARENFRGTALVAGDFALNASWGAGATVAVTAGNDSRFTIVITAGGAGRLANATCTLTFKDGAWAAAPFAQCAQIASSTAAELVDKITWTTTTTTLVITYVPVMVAAGTHTITGMVRG